MSEKLLFFNFCFQKQNPNRESGHSERWSDLRENIQREKDFPKMKQKEVSMHTFDRNTETKARGHIFKEENQVIQAGWTGTHGP